MSGVDEKTSVKAKLEVFFSKLRPSKKDLIEKNILPDTEGELEYSSSEKKQKRRSGLARLLSKKTSNKPQKKDLGVVDRGLKKSFTINLTSADKPTEEKKNRKLEKRSKSLMVPSTTSLSPRQPIGPQALSSPAVCHLPQGSTLQFGSKLPLPQLNLSVLTQAEKIEPAELSPTGADSEDEKTDTSAKSWSEPRARKPPTPRKSGTTGSKPGRVLTPRRGLAPGRPGRFGTSPWATSAYQSRMSEIEVQEPSILQDNFKQSSKLNLATHAKMNADHVIVTKENKPTPAPAAHQTPFFDSLMDQMDF